MGEIRSLALFVLITLVAISPSRTLGQDEKPQRTVSYLNKLSVHNLVERLDTAPYGRWNDNEIHRETVLIELLNRNYMELGELLVAKLESNAMQLPQEEKLLRELEQDESRNDEIGRQYERVQDLQRNLELLTAYRRWEEKPDPVAIEVSVPANGLKGGTRELPVIDVALVNVDPDKNALWMTKGGDYRSGRQARWRIHVWNSSGQSIPVRGSASFMGGGVYSEGYVEPGEKLKTRLNLNSYVDIPDAGRYTCQVLYHNTTTIADIESENELEKMIVFRSSEFEIEIEKGPMIEIELTKDIAAQASSLVDELKGQDVVRYISGEYTRQFHDFIDPESPEGKLLTMKWKALPALLDALGNSEMDVHKRAFIFGLLFSISNERSLAPDSDVLGAYRVEYGNGSSEYSGGPPKANKQQAFAEKWLKFRDDYVRISYADE